MGPYLKVLLVAGGVAAGATGLTTVSEQGAPRAGEPEVVARPVPGTTLPMDTVHRVARPEFYGLMPIADGGAHAVAHGYLIRIDPETGKVLAVLRPQSRILDAAGPEEIASQ